MTQFASLAHGPYQGPISPRNVGEGAAFKSSRAPTGIPFVVTWADYFVSLGSVANYGIDLSCNIGNAPIDVIKSVYVDNSQNILPVTVYFSDTQFGITVNGGAQAWLPVFTRSLQATLYVIGMTSKFAALATAIALSTRVLFMNVDAVPFSQNATGPQVATTSFRHATVTFTSASFPVNGILLPQPGPGFLNLITLRITQRPFAGAVNGSFFANVGIINAISTDGPCVSSVPVYLMDYNSINARLSAAQDFQYQVVQDLVGGFGAVTLDFDMVYTYPVL